MEKCAQCASQSNLRRCTGCLEVWYCSTECQEEHWSQHQRTCREPRRAKRKSKKARNRAAARRSREAAKKNEDESSPSEKTHDEGHQDGSAQRESSQGTGTCETRERNQTMDDGTRQEGDDPSVATGGVSKTAGVGGKEMMCKKCKTSAKNLAKCGRCKKVVYCSRDCQRADWPSHKVTCTSPDAIVTKGYRQMQEQEREQTRATQEAAEGLRLNFMAHLLRNLHMTHPMTWVEARSRAAGTFPGQPMVERFGQLPGGIFGRLLFPIGPVLLCRITRPYPHLFRHARCVEDVEGNELYVVFYNEEPPWPYFQYHQLREGNFLCLIDAHIHCFFDGSVGFRINNPAHVRIIE